MENTAPSFDAVVFDLLTALLDSWTTWNGVAGSETQGLLWRRAYLRLTYGCGAYQPYEQLVRQAASEVGLQPGLADALTAAWSSLQPWPEATRVLGTLACRGIRLAVATNCSTALGRQAAAQVGVPFDVVLTAEEVGFYKPRPELYRAVLDRLDTVPSRTLFVAGSPADVPGAGGVGMPVFWHNRAALAPLPSAAKPLMVARNLDGLLALF